MELKVLFLSSGAQCQTLPQCKDASSKELVDRCFHEWTTKCILWRSEFRKGWAGAVIASNYNTWWLTLEDRIKLVEERLNLYLNPFRYLKRNKIEGSLPREWSAMSNAQLLWVVNSVFKLCLIHNYCVDLLYWLFSASLCMWKAIRWCRDLGCRLIRFDADMIQVVLLFLLYLLCWLPASIGADRCLKTISRGLYPANGAPCP